MFPWNFYYAGFFSNIRSTERSHSKALLTLLSIKIPPSKTNIFCFYAKHIKVGAEFFPRERNEPVNFDRWKIFWFANGVLPSLLHVLHVFAEKFINRRKLALASNLRLFDLLFDDLLFLVLSTNNVFTFAV